MTNDIDLPGFAEPVSGAQQGFRAILAAMSRPGSLHRMGVGLTPPACLDPATACVLLTLTDGETSLWLDPALVEARGWIAFHCGTSFTDTLERAAFVLAMTLPDLDGVHAGTDEGPEEAATVIVQVAALGEGAAYSLAGPGLAAASMLRVRGLPDGFIDVWRKNHALYPRGVDLVLCAGTQLAALPRSVRIEEG